MMKIILFVFAFLLIIKIFAQPCREIIAYYPGWQWYDRNKFVDPDCIRYNRYSILNFAFFRPGTDGSISGTDPYSDERLLKGETNWSTTPPTYYPNTSLVDLAHNEQVKVLISIGGWNDSWNFPSIAADPVKRGNFAHHCVLLCKEYLIDGIDLDWEYPGYAPNGGTPADKVNFTLFVRQIRDSLTSLEPTIGHLLLLTTCIGASAAHYDQIEWSNVLPYLHSVNLMSYDFFGSWDPVTNHNAPLYPPAQGDPEFNVQAAVQTLLNVYGVPPSKVTAGLPFYGRSVKTTGTPALFGPSQQQPDNATFWEDDGSPLYYNILNKMNLFTAHFDAQAGVPYLLGNGNLQTFVSYDDPASIAAKAAYIAQHNLKGAIIWELTGDYLETTPGSGILSATPLVDTLNAVFCQYTSVEPLPVYPSLQGFILEGNLIRPLKEDSGPYDVQMLSVDGRLHKVYRGLRGSFRLSEHDLSPGIWLIDVQNQHQHQMLKWCLPD